MPVYTEQLKPDTSYSSTSKPSPRLYPKWSQIESKWSEIDDLWSTYTISVYTEIEKPLTTYSSIPKPI